MSVITGTAPATAAETFPERCQCRHVSASSPMPGVPCGRPGTGFWLVGCLHEHVTQCWLCGPCGAGHRNEWCSECWQADGHLCPAMLAPAGAGAVA